MKKITYEKWVITFVENLSVHLNLHAWNIQVKISSKPKEYSEGCWAEVGSDSVYMQATLTTYPRLRESWDEREVDRVTEVLVHELCHLLIDPLHEHAVPFLSDTTRPMFTNILENVVQRTAMVIVKNLPKSLIPPR